jgi:hypothetical protein
MSQTAYQAPLFFPQQDAVSSDEYLLVINPDANIATDIRFFKNKVWELTGDFPSHYSQPHITIYNFLGFQQKEDHIKSALKEVVTSLKSSFIYLENFQSFEGSGTIYIAPRPRNYFSLLLKSLYPSLVNFKFINRKLKIFISTVLNFSV